MRAVAGGAFSAYAVATLRPGDTVDVLPPLGHFTTAFAADRARHYAAVAAGSGITPVLSLVATALATEPASRVTLVYANRYARSVMFADELADRERSRADLSHTFDALSASAEFMMTIATAVVFLSGFLAVGTAGAGVGPALAAGSAALVAREAAKKAIEKILALAKIGYKAYLGYLLVAAYAALLADYEFRTLEVTSSNPGATP